MEGWEKGSERAFRRTTDNAHFMLATLVRVQEFLSFLCHENHVDDHEVRFIKKKVG